MPDTPELQAHFGQPGNQRKGCGFPVAHLLALFHAGTGLLLEAFAAPLRSHDMGGIIAILALLTAGDVLVADRGFCSFAHLAMLMSHGVHAVFRLHQKQIVDFTPGRPTRGRGGSEASRGCRGAGGCRPAGRWINWSNISSRRAAEVDERRGIRGVARVDHGGELRYRIKAAGFRTREVTLVTTLLDGGRTRLTHWLNFMGRGAGRGKLKSLKQTMGMDVLKCMTVDGVLKELTMYALAYNLVRVAWARQRAVRG